MERSGPAVEEFAELRRTTPVWWNPQRPDKSGGLRDGSYWVVTKHADIRAVSRDSDVWSSNAKGSNRLRPSEWRLSVSSRGVGVVEQLPVDGVG